MTSSRNTEHRAPSTGHRIDAAIARYSQLKLAAAGLTRAQKELVRLARRHGVRRAGRLVLLGRRNLAELVREAAAFIPRHTRAARWKVTRVDVRDSGRRPESPRAQSRGNGAR